MKIFSTTAGKIYDTLQRKIIYGRPKAGLEIKNIWRSHFSDYGENLVEKRKTLVANCVDESLNKVWFSHLQSELVAIL